MLPGKQLRTVTRSVHTHSRRGLGCNGSPGYGNGRCGRPKLLRVVPAPHPGPERAARTPSAARSQGATQPVPPRRARTLCGSRTSSAGDPGGGALHPRGSPPGSAAAARTARPHLLVAPRRAARPLRRRPRVLPPARGPCVPGRSVSPRPSLGGGSAGLAALCPRSCAPSAAPGRPRGCSLSLTHGRRRAQPPPRLLRPQGGGPGAGRKPDPGAAGPAGPRGAGASPTATPSRPAEPPASLGLPLAEPPAPVASASPGGGISILLLASPPHISVLPWRSPHPPQSPGTPAGAPPSTSPQLSRPHLLPFAHTPIPNQAPSSSPTVAPLYSPALPCGPSCGSTESRPSLSLGGPRMALSFLTPPPWKLLTPSPQI